VQGACELTTLCRGAISGGMGNAAAVLYGMLLAAVGVVCVWMCTDMFPWRYVFALTGGVLEILQFSWRFLAIAAPCLCLCGGLGYALLLKDQGAKGLLAVLAVAVLCTTPVIEHALDMPVIEFGQDGSPYILTPEYQFEGTDLEATKDRSVLTQGDIQLSQYEKNGTRISVHVDAQDDAKVTFPLFGFEGYEAELDGRLISWTRGENNRITVALEKGTQGMLSIRFAGNLIWIAADGVSLLCLLALVGYGMKKRRAMRFDGGKCR